MPTLIWTAASQENMNFSWLGKEDEKDYLAICLPNVADYQKFLLAIQQNMLLANHVQIEHKVGHGVLLK